MNYIATNYVVICSKCRSANRFFPKIDGYGRGYKVCADCGHSNQPPPPEPCIYSSGDTKGVEFF